VKTVALTGTEPNGQFFIDCPPNNTSIIVYGNTGQYTSTYNNGFEMISNMRNLYYIWQPGNGEASNPNNFRLVDYNAFNVPQDPPWLLLASTMGRPAQYANILKWVPGGFVFPGEFSFSPISYTYDTTTGIASWLDDRYLSPLNLLKTLVNSILGYCPWVCGSVTWNGDPSTDPINVRNTGQHTASCTYISTGTFQLVFDTPHPAPSPINMPIQVSAYYHNQPLFAHYTLDNNVQTTIKLFDASGNPTNNWFSFHVSS
jgi:hypothetical protein